MTALRVGVACGKRKCSFRGSSGGDDDYDDCGGNRQVASHSTSSTTGATWGVKNLVVLRPTLPHHQEQGYVSCMPCLALVTLVVLVGLGALIAVCVAIICSYLGIKENKVQAKLAHQQSSSSWSVALACRARAEKKNVC